VPHIWARLKTVWRDNLRDPMRGVFGKCPNSYKIDTGTMPNRKDVNLTPVQPGITLFQNALTLL